MSKQFYFKESSLAWVRSLNLKTVLFQVNHLFTVITRTLLVGVLPLCSDVIGVFYSPKSIGQNKFYLFNSSRKFVEKQKFESIFLYEKIMERKCSPNL